MPRFGDGIDLRDDDRGTGVEGEADCGVVVTWNTEVLCQRCMVERRGRRTYRTQGMVRPSDMNWIS